MAQGVKVILTEKQEKWLSKHYKHTKNKDIAERLGVSEATIHRLASKKVVKKILILLAAICCSGCSTGVAKEEPTQPLNVKYYYRDPVLHLYTVEVEGHLYIIYAGNNKGGILHAEHCPCKMK